MGLLTLERRGLGLIPPPTTAAVWPFNGAGRNFLDFRMGLDGEHFVTRGGSFDRSVIRPGGVMTCGISSVSPWRRGEVFSFVVGRVRGFVV